MTAPNPDWTPERVCDASSTCLSCVESEQRKGIIWRADAPHLHTLRVKNDDNINKNRETIYHQVKKWGQLVRSGRPIN